MPERGSARRRAIGILAAVGVLVTVLGLIGVGVEDHLRPTSLSIGGTSSARGEELARERFGESSPFAVLLRGPAAAVERQGRHLAAVLRRDRALTVISPWDPASPARAIPAPDPNAPPTARSRALLLLDYHVPLADAMRDTVPALEDTLDANIHPPVRGHAVGIRDDLARTQHESLDAAERAELLAVPLLLIVLLLVFRSVAAALIPLALGAVTVLAGRGVLVFLTSLMPIDALSLVVCTMMGLALGVDYSLLIVSRFREELDAGRAARRGGEADSGQRRADDGDRRRHPLRLDLSLGIPSAGNPAGLAGGGAGDRDRARGADRLGGAPRSPDPARAPHQRGADRQLRSEPGLPRRRRRRGGPAAPGSGDGLDRRASTGPLGPRAGLRHRLARGRRAFLLEHRPEGLGNDLQGGRRRLAGTLHPHPGRQEGSGHLSRPARPAQLHPAAYRRHERGRRGDRSRGDSRRVPTASRAREGARPGGAPDGLRAHTARSAPARCLGRGGTDPRRPRGRLGGRRAARRGIGAGGGGGWTSRRRTRPSQRRRRTRQRRPRPPRRGLRTTGRGPARRRGNGLRPLPRPQHPAAQPHRPEPGARPPSLHPSPAGRGRRSVSGAGRPRSQGAHLRPLRQPRRNRSVARPGPASEAGPGQTRIRRSPTQRGLGPDRRRSQGADRRLWVSSAAAPRLLREGSANCGEAPKL